MKKIFIAATRQNEGKTTVSLGLIFNLLQRFKKVAFIKPIGQRYLQEEGFKIDEDSVLIEKVLASCRPKAGIKDMSPVAMEKGFTEKYIDSPNKKPITKQITDSYRRISKGQDLVIIEGTGHAGVGSVFDHSNAQVARLLGSKVIIISSGGIGRPIDEIALDKALFEREGVHILGVIINKVLPEKLEKVSRLVRKGLKRKGITVLGVIPYEAKLSCPSIEQILDETRYELLCGRGFLGNYVSRFIVGAMKAQDAIKYIADDSFLITPGDREDVITAFLECYRDTDKKRLKISGMVLTGGIAPDKTLMSSLQNAGIPVLSTKSDTYNVASCLHDLTVKIRPQDTEKINTAVKLIQDNVDLDTIMKGL